MSYQFHSTKFKGESIHRGLLLCNKQVNTYGFPRKTLLSIMSRVGLPASSLFALLTHSLIKLSTCSLTGTNPSIFCNFLYASLFLISFSDFTTPRRSSLEKANKSGVCPPFLFSAAIRLDNRSLTLSK